MIGGNSPEYEAIYGSSFSKPVPKPTFKPKAPLKLAPATSSLLSQTGAYRHGSLQVLQPLHEVQDIVATYGQHLQPKTGQVLWLPLETCAYLLARQPTLFAKTSVVPQGVLTGLDGGTGLDTLDTPSTLTWGYGSGVGYFTPDGDVGHDESAQVSVDVNNVVYIETE